MNYSVITTYNEKGGVGKSTCAAHLAFSLATYGKVLLIDGDPQGDASKHFVDPEKLAEHGKTFGTLLTGNSSFDETVINVREEKDGFYGLYMLGTITEDRSLNQFIQYEIREKPRKIKQVIKEAKLNDFAFIIIDLPSLWDNYHQLILECCDLIIPTVHCENLAVSHLFELIDKLKIHRENFEAEYDLNHIIVNAYDKDSVTQKAFLDLLTEIEAFDIFICNKTNELPKATLNHQVLQEYRKKHPAIDMFNEIAEKINAHNLEEKNNG